MVPDTISTLKRKKIQKLHIFFVKFLRIVPTFLKSRILEVFEVWSWWAANLSEPGDMGVCVRLRKNSAKYKSNRHRSIPFFACVFPFWRFQIHAYSIHSCVFACVSFFFFLSIFLYWKWCMGLIRFYMTKKRVLDKNSNRSIRLIKQNHLHMQPSIGRAIENLLF